MGHTSCPPEDCFAVLASFWQLGLLNNAGYVVMLAGANAISSGSVGLVYLCAVGPAVVVKLTAPYCTQFLKETPGASATACTRFHLVAYPVRMVGVAVLMSAAYLMVALNQTRGWQLLGVVLSAAQSGLGEATCLALCSRYDGTRVLTCWSSGTGFAGVAGYLWVGLLHMMLGMSFRSTVLLANFTSVAWLATYFLLLQPAPSRLKRKTSLGQELKAAAPESQPALPSVTEQQEVENEVATLLGPAETSSTEKMNWRDRAVAVQALWPYMIPLTTVYFAEYAMQAGAWVAIGFPTDSVAARRQWYQYSNWTYQLGVFVSRSSGTVYQASRRQLWIMPGLQICLLLFFSLDAAVHFWYNYWLLVPALLTGLLGGAVYVNAFTLITREVAPALQEFSLGAASLADSLGVAFADVAGIVLQGCLFKINGLQGADFTC